MTAQSRNDANESLFFARDLEFQESKVYEKEYPAIKFRQIFPVDNSGGPGTLYVTYKMIDKAGMAQVLADAADDPPRVNLSAQEFTARVFPVADSCEYSQFELDAAQKTGTNLDGMLLDTARQAYERKLDEIASQGHTPTGLLGFNSNPNIPIATPTTSSGPGDDTWPNKTADEILADFTKLYRTVIANTLEVHQPTAVLLSTDRMSLLKQVRLSNTGVFLLTALKDAYQGMEFLEWHRMATAGVGSVQRMAMYVRSPDVVQFREPAPFKIMPLRRSGAFRWSYDCAGHTAGVVVRYPLACAFMDGI